MKDSAKEEIYIGFNWKLALKIALKTIVSSLIVLCFVLCSIFFISPNLSLRIANVIGSKKAQEVNYVNVYKRSGKLSDLYNVILIESDLKNYKTELQYLEKMTSSEGYEDFCKAVDQASLANIANPDLIPYVCDVDGFFKNQVVTCKYNLKQDLETFIYIELKKGKATNLVYATYVDLINKDDKLTEKQKAEKILTLFATFELGEDDNPIKINRLVMNNIDALKSQIAESKSFNDAIVLQYALMRDYRALYMACLMSDDLISAEDYWQLYLNSKNDLANHTFNYLT